MKKVDAKLGARVACYHNSKLVGRGRITFVPKEETPGYYAVILDNRVLADSFTLEQMRLLLRPKKKKECICSREPDGWAIVLKSGRISSIFKYDKRTVIEIAKNLANEFPNNYSEEIAPFWIGAKERVK